MGGAERVAVSLSNWLANKKNDIGIISMDCNKSSYEVNSNVQLYINVNKLEKGRFKGFLQRYKYVSKILSDSKPDVIFSVFYTCAIIPIIYKIIHHNKKICIISSERCNPNSPDRKKNRKLMYNAIVKLCDGFIFQTERVKSLYSKDIQKKGVVIYNPISNPLLEKIKYIPVSNKEKTISSMGRLENQKAFDILIKAFKLVIMKHPDYRLFIYGEGSERIKLEKLIDEFNLNNKVILYGNCSNALIEISKSRVFILSSRYEGMPNSLLEAMGAGVACISTNCEFGPAEIIDDGKNGFLVPINDYKTIAEKINYLLDNESIIEKIGLKAKNIKNIHSLNNCFSKYEQYFKSFIVKRSKKE